MKVLLLEHIPQVGHKYDVKNVRDGYARNFLFPRNLAEPATEKTLRTVATQKATAAQQHEKEGAEYKTLADAAGGAPLVFAMKVGGKGQVFGSVSAADIAAALATRGQEIKKEWIALDEPIKTTGEKIVPLHFPHEVKGELTIHVTAEEAS